MTTPVYQRPETDWKTVFPGAVQAEATDHLENGFVLLFPKLTFSLSESEKRFLDPSVVGKSKNVSFNPANKRMSGTTLEGSRAEELSAAMNRFAAQTKELLLNLLPKYRPGLSQGRTSFRPVEVAGRVTSWRKDDTRLHVDCFPSTPLQGKRIIRVFSNVNPQGRPRSWKVGEPFEDLAGKFLGRLKKSPLGAHGLLHLLRVTRSKRSDYDHYMLQLHDRMKEDNDYQQKAPQTNLEMPAGGTWIVYTDQVSHAALAGQFQFEQTFYLPVSSMARPETSPLRVLEKLSGRTLVKGGGGGR